MLQYLHVKNLALIEEAEVDFEKGLNIMTGETGAGKSILIDSVNMALGGKVSKHMIRTGAEYAFAELVFQVTDPRKIEKIKTLGIHLEEDGQIILSRKIMNNRNLCKINGETVTLGSLKKTAEELIDVHGQHEHQSLLYKKNHLEILDEYGKEEIQTARQKVKEAYENHIKIKNLLSESVMDEEVRRREIAFAEFEVHEIEEADLKPGEDETLEQHYQRMNNARKIIVQAGAAYELTGEQNAGEQIGRALSSMNEISRYDGGLTSLCEQIADIDSLLNDFNRELSDYISNLEFSEEEYRETETRLDLINHLKAKYGNSLEDILVYQKEKEAYLEKMHDYEIYIDELHKKEKEAETILNSCADILSSLREKYALPLADEIEKGLKDLNFLDVSFKVEQRPLASSSPNGKDEVEFMISVNPGEPAKPLGAVASGGELSRIMLAIKTVLADRDEIDTLIFDEIDVGISGRTAQKVSEKLAVIGKNRQVLCITHLPQIAAMADTHFSIEKNKIGMATKTIVRKLKPEEMITELARILSGAEITDKVMQSASEMKELAERTKKY